jgi:hypothetical protein
LNLWCRLGGALGCLLLVAAGAQRAQATTSSVPSIVLRASSTFDTTLRGVVGMQRHFSTELQAGPLTHREESDSGLLMQDGRFVRIAYFRIVRDGHPYSPSQIQQRDDEANRDWAAGKVFFKEPYDPRYIGDYSFASPQAGCSECPPGTKAVTFASTIHDSQHGSGTMYVDTNDNLVIRLNYTPYTLPPHASSGSVTEIGGRGLPDLWYVVRIKETYGGRVFLMNGSGAFSGAFDNFRRFANLGAGEAALQNQTI